MIEKYFVPYVDFEYDDIKWFIDSDHEYNWNPEVLNGWYIYIVKNRKLLISKRVNDNWRLILHSDLAQGQNIDFGWEIQFVAWIPKTFSNGSWHYKPSNDGKNKVPIILKTMWYLWEAPQYNNY